MAPFVVASWSPLSMSVETGSIEPSVSSLKGREPEEGAARPDVGLSHLSYMAVGGKLMVMDRFNAKWVFLSPGEEPFLRLLMVARDRLHENLSLRVRKLEERLSCEGLGGPEPTTGWPLSTLILKLTNACNFACAYCYDYEPSEKAASLSTESAVEAIAQALDLCGGALHVLLHGGEPTLMFKRIKDIVLQSEAIADRMRKSVIFSGQTNLSLLNAEIVEFSTRHSIGWGISLDGPAELNDKFRVTTRKKATYRLFEDALRRFPEFVRRLSVMTTVTAANDSKLLQIASHFREIGMPAWDWALFQNIGRGRDIDSLDLLPERLIRSWNRLLASVEEGEFDGFRVGPVYWYLHNLLSGPGANMCLRRHCGAGRDLMSISADGTIEACDCIDPLSSDAGLGHISDAKEQSLARALNSDKAEKIRARDVALGKCGDCIWMSACGGTCGAHAETAHGVSEKECAIAMNAFAEISKSLALSSRLLRYYESVSRPSRYVSKDSQAPRR